MYEVYEGIITILYSLYYIIIMSYFLSYCYVMIMILKLLYIVLLHYIIKFVITMLITLCLSFVTDHNVHVIVLLFSRDSHTIPVPYSIRWVYIFIIFNF